MSAEPVRLEVVAGRAEGMSILVDDELVIGRQADGAGRLADDDEISRSHARVTLDASGFCAIEDLGSTNGTFVNGLRIAAPQTLFDGDTIELGGTTLVVHGLASTPAGEAQIAAPEAPEAPATPLAGEGAPPTVFESAPPTVFESAPPTVFESAPPRPSEAQQTPAQELPEPDATIVPGAMSQAPPDMGGERQPAQEVGEASAPVDADGADAPRSGAAPASIQIAVDFDARELTVVLGDEDEPLRLVHDGRRWRGADSAG
jgi:predicted component of type VI protein secretion system